jgi:hypothetical protein
MASAPPVQIKNGLTGAALTRATAGKRSDCMAVPIKIIN